MEGFKNFFQKSPELKKKEKASLEELREPVSKIAEELSEEIENGAYSSIIADEASGRIPALMLGYIMQKVYREHGYPDPLLRPIAGSTGLKSEKEQKQENKKRAVSEHISHILSTLDKAGRERKKVLIITDTIKNGESVEVLINALKENNWDADVATLGLEVPFPDNWQQELQKRWGSKVVYAMQGTPLIYNKGKKLSGVTKENTELFSRPNKESQEKIRKGRIRIKEIANEITQEYLEKHTQLKGGATKTDTSLDNPGSNVVH